MPQTRQTPIPESLTEKEAPALPTSPKDIHSLIERGALPADGFTPLDTAQPSSAISSPSAGPNGPLSFAEMLLRDARGSFLSIRDRLVGWDSPTDDPEEELPSFRKSLGNFGPSIVIRVGFNFEDRRARS